MSTKEEQHEDSPSSGRPRRSAASGKKVWQTLMGKQGKDDAEDYSDTPRVATRKRRKADQTPEPAGSQSDLEKPAAEPKKKATEKTPDAPKLKSEALPPAKDKPAAKLPPKLSPAAAAAPPPAPASQPSSQNARVTPSIALPQGVKAQTLANGSKAAAPDKHQIGAIEKEMSRTYRGPESDDFDDVSDEEDYMGLFEDYDDMEFMRGTKPKRSYTKRVPATSNSASKAKGRAIAAAVGQSLPPKPTIGSFAHPVQSFRTGDNPLPRIVARPTVQTMRHAASSASYTTLPAANDNRQFKFICRPPLENAPFAGRVIGNGDSSSSLPQTIGASQQKSAPLTEAQSELQQKIQEKQLRVLELQEENLIRQNAFLDRQEAYFKLKVQQKAEEMKIPKEKVEELLGGKK